MNVCICTSYVGSTQNTNHRNKEIKIIFYLNYNVNCTKRNLNFR